MRLLLIGLLLFATAGVALAAGPEFGTQLVVNGGADESPAPPSWTGSGWTRRDYTSIPAPRTDMKVWDGSTLFAGPAGSSMTQNVSLVADAANIDAGNQTLNVIARLGGMDDDNLSAKLVAQPLDAAGAAVGEPMVMGPPTTNDRDHRSGLIDCGVHLDVVPPGTRSVRLTLTAEGTGPAGALALADVINLFDGAYIVGGVGILGTAYDVAEAPNCESVRYDPAVWDTPTQTPSPTLTPTPSATPTPAPSPIASALALVSTHVSFALASAGRVQVIVDRRLHGAWRTVRVLNVAGGPRAVRRKLLRLRAGHYRVTVHSLTAGVPDVVAGTQLG